MKKVLIPLFIVAALMPIVAFAQSLPVPPTLPTSTAQPPSIDTITNWIAALGALVYGHILTVLFFVVGLGLFSMLPPIISGTLILLAIAVAIYFWKLWKQR